jgi:MFS family permease
MLVTGLFMMLQMAASNTILQTVVEEDKRGRVMSLFSMAYFGSLPFGSLFAGALATRVGAQNTILIGGIACLFAAAAFLRAVPGVQRAVQPIYARMGLVPALASGLDVGVESVPPSGRRASTAARPA